MANNSDWVKQELERMEQETGNKHVIDRRPVWPVNLSGPEGERQSR